MRARIPQDVDLEDRLAFGLTPTRFGYLALAALAAFTLWTARWAPWPVRALAALPVAGVGAGLAWGRWHGRSLDHWAADLIVYLVRYMGTPLQALRRRRAEPS